MVMSMVILYWQVIVSIFTPNRYVFILLTVLTIYLLFFRVMKKYMLEYPLSVILFMGMLFYFSMLIKRGVWYCNSLAGYSLYLGKKVMEIYACCPIGSFVSYVNINCSFILFYPIKTLFKEKVL